jgi:outer membrane receptor protein involved in Fe transport
VYAQAAEAKQFNIPTQSLVTTLTQIGRQTGSEVVFSATDVRGRQAPAVRGALTADAALQQALQGSGLKARRTTQGAYAIEQDAGAGEPQAGVAGDNAEDIIVTAQKREERIQDVPIAITALSSKALDDRKIEGGPELLRAVPNVSFSKSNFSMYNISIRGIGTKAISASSDPAVAVSFNNIPLVRNRLFEQEFFDLQRVEVLRGPQGTLYGRNATAGVVNVISALPSSVFEGEGKLEVGNYDTMRASGMLNVPLTDTLGVRVAGAWTSRDGFDYNSFTDRRVNGRDLWSTRATVAWEPSDRFRANLIWQHFEEDDDRSRTGKQLCTRDPGPATVGNIALTDPYTRGRLSQGCLPGSLYDDAAFGAPNGNSLTYVLVPTGIGLGRDPITRASIFAATPGVDPFANVVQSRDLREIATSYDPVFRAKNDVVQLNLEFEPSDGLKFVSQTGYSRDRFYSSQDYNRFVSAPFFNSSTQPLLNQRGQLINPAIFPGATPGGQFCDPQLGCSDRLLSADLSQSASRQWSQEFRLQSDFDGPVNFNIGVNYLDF